MYQGHEVLCIIPARGGSKGLPGKNIRPLLGKPLIAYTIEQARRSEHVDRILVSTDDPAIAEIAKRWGGDVPFLRPPELAGDETSVIDALIHAIRWIEERESRRYDIVVLLHVTAPLREPRDIDACIAMLVDQNAENVFSVTEASRNPYFNMVETGEDGRVRLVKEGRHACRQSAPKVFEMNAAVYVWWRDLLLERRQLFLEGTRIYLMPRSRSVDIDDELDFKFAETLLRESQDAEKHQNHPAT